MSNIKEVVEKIRSQVYVDDEPFKLTDEEAESLIRELVEKENKVVPYQLCPKCHGQKTVSIPPYVPGDAQIWSAASAGPYICGICNGAGIIPQFTAERK